MSSKITRPSMPLSAGSIWRGCQMSGTARCDVEIRICSVDELGDVSGTLTIRNLTPSLPKLVTFFNGEIIGPHHSFSTNKWEATEQDDNAHWKRFNLDLPPCYPEADSEDEESREDIVFLRLKERCILNKREDANGQTELSGASFSGFYYIAIELNPSPTFSTGRKREVVNNPPAISNLTRSLLLSTPPTPCDTPVHAPFESPSSAPQLTRSGSYASVVRRGRTPPASPTGRTILLPSSISKSEEVITTAVVASPFSLSLDEYPLPSSPFLASPPEGRNAFPFENQLDDDKRARLRSHSRTRSSSKGLGVVSTDFANCQTGYRGPWAHSVMRGFYFASSSEPFQEIELRYVGDGLGMIREEEEDVDVVRSTGIDCNEEEDALNMLRRSHENTSRYRCSASFEMM